MVYLFSRLHAAILFSIMTTILCLKIEDDTQRENNNKTTDGIGHEFTKISYLKMVENNTRLQESSPIVHRQFNNEGNKENLSRFTMARKRAIPINYESLPNWNINSFEAMEYLNSEDAPETELFKTKEYVHSEDVPNTKLYKPNEYFNSEDVPKTKLFYTNEYLNHEDDQIFNVLRNQTVLIGKVAEALEMERHAMRSRHEFENLLTEMDLAKKSKSTTEVSTTVKEVKKLSTVMTAVDESEVRKALKSDPLVKRILKMARMKRLQYVKAAKRYYKS